MDKLKEKYVYVCRCEEYFEYHFSETRVFLDEKDAYNAMERRINATANVLNYRCKFTIKRTASGATFWRDKFILGRCKVQKVKVE